MKQEQCNSINNSNVQNICSPMKRKMAPQIVHNMERDLDDLALLAQFPRQRLLAETLGNQTILVERRDNGLLTAKIFVVVVASLADISDLDIRQCSGTILVHQLVEKHRVQSVCLFAKGLLSAEDFSDGVGSGNDGVGNAAGRQFG